MKNISFIILFLATSIWLQAQEILPDSILRYSLPELDSIFQTKKKPKEQLYYALAMNQKGEKELDTNDTAYAKLLFKTGNTYQRLRDWSNSIIYLEKAIEIWKLKVPIHEEHAKCFNILGMVYIRQGKYKEAEKNWLQAKGIYLQSLGEQHSSYAKILNNLANLYGNIGDYASAEPLFKEVLKIYKTVLGDQLPDYAHSLQGLAILYNSIKSYNAAEPLFKEALKIYKTALGDHRHDYANCLDNLALLYRSMGSYNSAEPLFQEALSIKKELLGEQHPDYAGSLNNLANLYKRMGKYSDSELLFQEALKIYKTVLGEQHPDYASVLKGLAYLYKDMGEYKKAELYYRNCFELINNNLSINFSWLPEKGKAAYWQMEKVFYEHLNEFAALAAENFPPAVELAYNSKLTSKGLLLESSKEVEDAANNCKDSITLKVYENLRDKRRLINNMVSTGTVKKEIIDRYNQEADSLDKILVNRLGEYAASKRKFQINWKDVMTVLSENEAAIEFSRYYDRKDSLFFYQALLLRKGYELPKLVKLGSEKAIAAVPAGKGFSELYKLIWEPMDSLLQDVNTIYYSPDGKLNNISFAALCGKGKETELASNEIKRGSKVKTVSKIENCIFLSDRYTLHQLSTTRYLAEGLKDSKIDNSLLVFGGVIYDEIPSNSDTLSEPDMADYALSENITRSSANQSRMEYLPGTKTELQSLQKILNKKQWKVRAFSDKNASENNLKSEVKKESPGILHIATHGFAFPDVEEKKKGFGEENKTYRDADNPMARCGLLLAGANHSWLGKADTMLAKTGEDGILTALEVSNLPLRNTKLVVLSACETGLGKIEGSEGTFGLKRGFKLAGVEQIIVSLWSVPDKETMELMELFYTDLSKTHSAVISFKKAQKEMRIKYPSEPEKWAGFVLVR